KVTLTNEVLEPPPLLKELITNKHPKSASFIDNIRRYNSMFAFTSMGGKQDTSVNVGRGPYCYQLHGENYHLAGPLLPADGKLAKFAQLYIFDTKNEIQNRIGAVSNGESSSSRNNELYYQLTTDICDLLDEINPQRDGRHYNLPTVSELADLIVGDFDSTKQKRDIILHCQDGDFKRISELHTSYLALHYLLFSPYGEDNYRSDIFYEGVTDYDEKNKGTRLTMKQYFAYRIQERKNEFSMMLNGRRLFQQFIVDTYTMIESERLTFNRKNDKDLRSKTGLKSEDRPDVISRVFKIKLDCLMKELNDGHIFGRVKGGKIDEYISAEIPNKDDDPELYQLFTSHMMHGPCGADNPSCPCTIEYKCTKKFPRQFNETIVIDDSGYALYKRRHDGNIIKKSGTDFHNGYVVPYNPGLLRRYQAHINVEWCNQVGSIKYLFKYINKGPDRVSATVDGEEVDEIKDFLNCRYLSACEAAWRIYGFEIHYRTPSIEWFLFHLKDEQQVIFDATESIDYAVDKSSKQSIWTRRKQGKSLGRIHHVPQSWGELYYLHTILNKVRGPMEWDDLKKVDDVLYPTYRDACYARGLLQDDKEYIDGILEASLWGIGDYLRSIFVMLIMTNSMSRPEIVWEKTWMKLAEDVLNVKRIKQDLELSDIQRKNICLSYIECMLRSNNWSLKDIQNMPFPDQEYTMDGYNRLIYDETSYDKDQLQKEHVKLYRSLTTEQKGIYSAVMDFIDNNKGGMFFVYGYGGTEKTYLYKTMSAALRSKGDIVLNVASSGIAALLLEGGRTAHSRFAIPINVVEDSMCHIAADSDLADLIRKANLNIWDEAPMISRHYYEAFDRTLQILLVITNGGNGKVGGANDGESTIVFPDSMLIPETDDDVGVIIDDTYPNLLQNLWNPSFFQDKAILDPTHEMVDIINERMLSLLLGDENEYEDSNFDDYIYYKFPK
nr:uncharacterized protein [Tanacetum cinerariifolium]